MTGQKKKFIRLNLRRLPAPIFAKIFGRLSLRHRFSLHRFARPLNFQAGEFSLSRANLAKIVFIAIYCTILTRAVIVHLYHSSSESLTSIGDRQYQMHMDLAPYRGGIYDRKGEPLAISIRRPSIAINPRLFRPSHNQVEELARLLHRTPREVRLLSAKKAYFSWLGRHLPHRTAERILEMGIEGVHTITEPARFYPVGSSAGHLIGNVGIDNKGLGGLELQFDNDLRGESTVVSPNRDGRGNKIFFDAETANPDKPGNNLYLTIDRAIQEIAEEAVAEGAKKAKAKHGFAIVSDPHTGRILAVANYPSYDPNESQRGKVLETKNHAFLDTYEPGSVMKSFVIGAAIEQRKTTPDETLFCENGVFSAGGRTFRDDHPQGYITTTDTLVRSSNICTFKLAMRIGKEGLFNTLTNVGFGGGLPNSTGQPAYTHGRLSRPERWPQIQFANIAFGQGLTVSGIEMVQGYGAIANGGNLMRPLIVDRIETPDGIVEKSFAPESLRRVFTPDTTRAMRQMLQKVVYEKHGTGSQAATEHYSVAGKTGTSQKVDPLTRAYSANKRVASFVGFAPVNDPYLVIYVVIDEPGERTAYGGLWAAPVFSKIAEESLRYLNVAPDKVQTASASSGSGKAFEL